MIARLRIQLARWLVGNSPVRQMIVYGCGMAQFMTQMGASKVVFMTADGNTYTVQKTTGEETYQLRCEVCTNVFDADPDRPTRCPSCGSANVGLASDSQ